MPWCLRFDINSSAFLDLYLSEYGEVDISKLKAESIEGTLDWDEAEDPLPVSLEQPESYLMFLPCSVCLHRGVDMNDISSCSFCKQLRKENKNRLIVKKFMDIYLNDEHGYCVRELPYKCNHCPKSFNSRRNLKTHLRIHYGEKLHKCKVCQKEFTRRYDVGRHMLIHTQSREKSFKCNECEKCFYEKRTLANHLRKHLKEAPNQGESETDPTSENNVYQCSVCLMNFQSIGHLYFHLTIHEKKYKCDECGKGFKQKHHVREHSRIHTGEKPYKCKLCQQKFRWKNSLKIHLRNHSKERPYECIVCKKDFTTYSNARRHIESHYLPKIVLLWFGKNFLGYCSFFLPNFECWLKENYFSP